METKGKTVKKGIGFCATGLGSNVCDIDVTEEKDKILRIRPYHFDETGDMERLNPWKIEVEGHVFEPGTKTTVTPMQIGYKKRIYSKNRILYPMKRVYQDHGARTDTIVAGVGGIDRGGANNLICPSAYGNKAGFVSQLESNVIWLR